MLPRKDQSDTLDFAEHRTRTGLTSLPAETIIAREGDNRKRCASGCRLLLNMHNAGRRRRTSPRTNQPIQTLSQFYLAHRPRNTEYDVSLLVEKCRCGNRLSHPQFIEIATLRAQTDEQMDSISAHKCIDLL